MRNAGIRARAAVENVVDNCVATHARLLAAGRSSQAWLVTDGGQRWVVRVPIPGSGRRPSFHSESVIGTLLGDANHPVCRWATTTVDGIECSVGPMLDGEPVSYEAQWTSAFAAELAALLQDLHRLEADGWGPLANDSLELRGMSASANEGVIDRWFHASIWPFDSSDLEDHPIASLEPDLVSTLAALEDSISIAADEPFGVVHSDLHKQHLLHIDGALSGLLDFGDAFVGSTAWDFALLRWYYGAANTRMVINAYQPGADLFERSESLAIAVGCYKIAKTPTDERSRARLRSLLTS